MITTSVFSLTPQHPLDITSDESGTLHITTISKGGLNLFNLASKLVQHKTDKKHSDLDVLSSNNVNVSYISTSPNKMTMGIGGYVARAATCATSSCLTLNDDGFFREDVVHLASTSSSSTSVRKHQGEHNEDIS